MASQITVNTSISFKVGGVNEAPQLSWQADWLAHGSGAAPDQIASKTLKVASSGYTDLQPWASDAWTTWGTNCYRAVLATLKNLSKNDGNTQFDGFSTSTDIGQCPHIVVATHDASSVPSTKSDVGQYEFMVIPPGGFAVLPLAINTTSLKVRAYRWNGSAFVACAATLGFWGAEQ